MAPLDEASYSAFRGREAATDGPMPIGTFESLGNLARAIWKNRGAISSSGAAAAKEIISDMPTNDPTGQKLSNQVMHMLWGSMLHPPSSYRGAKYQYRSANGSDNSMLYPDLGKGGQPYAKSIQAQSATYAAKPDVGDLFDLLMAREDDGVESTTGISSLLLYQATIVIHDVFRTNDDDKNISDTSSYLDLSPLYGADAQQQETVRTKKDGLLKPDTFAEYRLLNQPPGVTIFLIMYNRFHNYVAKQLKEINENGKFGLPANYDALPNAAKTAADAKQDEDLFQTARLITCGLYAQIAIHDYLRCLLMMHERDTSWTLDPRREFDSMLDKETVPRGQGNMVSVEFNLLYRFHSPLSKRDAWWAEELFSQALLPALANDPGTIDEKKAKIRNGETSAALMGGALKQIYVAWARDYEKRKTEPYFPPGFDPVGAADGKYQFQRNKEGYFDDAQMVAELVRCMEDPMCSFGSNQIPKVFKSIEMLGLLQSRKWEVCTLNEFRRFFGMSPHKRFEDINTSPKVYNKLRDLYVDVENVELYPGYLCEGAGRSVDPNTNLPNNATSALWRGIFSDAVTLVRSDRFYTTEWNVDSITSYGMCEVTSDPTINKGGLLYKLCHRAFPGYFKYNSLHLWEPYYTPERNLILAYEQNKLKDLDFDGLEYKYDGDDAWRSLDLRRNSEGVISDAFFKEVKKNPTKKLRLRRKLSDYTQERNLMQAYEQNKLKDLDFDGLEYKYDGDEAWQSLDLKPNSVGKVSDAFFNEVKSNPNRKVRVRRKLSSAGYSGNSGLSSGGYEPARNAASNEFGWRGQERATKVSTAKVVIGSYQGSEQDAKDHGDYDIIKNHILGGKDENLWPNPAHTAAYDIPKGPLRQILTNTYDNKRWNQAMSILGERMNVSHEGKIDTALFREYFLHMAEEIRVREQREFQKTSQGQVYQVDIVADYSIPIIARFFADWLGFWDRVKTVDYPGREFSENQIYELMDNCQDYQAWDSDHTKGMKRRQLYKKSIQKLKTLADYGVLKSSYGLLFWRNMFRSYGSDASEVVSVRKLAVQCTQDLLWKGFGYDEVASIMLQFALDTAHKLVSNFTESLAYFIDPKQRTNKVLQEDDSGTRHWAEIQQMAYTDGVDAHKRITKYVLEAMRLSPSIKLARQYIGKDKKTFTTTSTTNKTVDVQNGDTILLDISAASRNSKVFPSPNKFNPDRPTERYLIHGEDVDLCGSTTAVSFAKQLSLAYLTSLIQHLSMMRRVRVAHQERGQLKRVNLPCGLPGYPETAKLMRFASPQWDELLPFPCSWEVRYDGVYDGQGEGVFKDGDNADQGNGMDQVWRKDELSSAKAPSDPVSVTDKKIQTNEDKALAKTRVTVPMQSPKSPPIVTVTEIPDDVQ